MNLTRGVMFTATEVVKHLREEFGVEVSEETIRRGFCRQGLHAQVK